jgi:hypothetical protein
VTVLSLVCLGWAAPAQFSHQERIGLITGDQWEPAIAADGSGHIFVLYPHYGEIPGCDECRAPAMLLVSSNDNGKTWQAPRLLLASISGQFDAQIVIDPADRHTLYAAWLQAGKRAVIVAKSIDSGVTWAFTVAARSTFELDKPVLTVRGPNAYIGFNYEDEVWVAASADGGRSFTPVRVNNSDRPGWSLLGGAAVDPSGHVYVAWASYAKAGGARGAVNLYVAKSTDGGKTWTPTVLDVSAIAPGCASEACSEAFLGAQIAIAADASGTLYATWSAGSVKQGPQRIYFSSSIDGGETWRPRLSLSATERGAEHAFPAIVAGSAGDVRVAWMDSRNAPYWNTYYRSSTNGGATWSDEARLSSYVPGYRYIAKRGFRFPFGDYFGIAIDNHNDTHAVWGEGMNYQSPGSIWHASGK